jgi:hypothetical protein|eukprot:COSAG01_NODE_6441_length_3663_cov_2.253367_2_plen_53_part_00
MLPRRVPSSLYDTARGGDAEDAQAVERVGEVVVFPAGPLGLKVLLPLIIGDL